MRSTHPGPSKERPLLNARREDPAPWMLDLVALKVVAEKARFLHESGPLETFEDLEVDVLEYSGLVGGDECKGLEMGVDGGVVWLPAGSWLREI